MIALAEVTETRRRMRQVISLLLVCCSVVNLRDTPRGVSWLSKPAHNRTPVVMKY